MDRKDKLEVFAGGTFGIIAIIAAIIEFSLPDYGAIAGCIKDIFGTLVVVVVLFASIKFRAFGIESVLKNAVEDWGADNAPLIFKIESYEAAQGSSYSQGFALLQKPRDYVSLVKRNLKNGTEEWNKYAKYSRGNHLTGKFIDMPSYKEMTHRNFSISIGMKQKHFSDIPDFQIIFKDIVDAVDQRDGVKARPIGQSAEFVLEFDEIRTKGDVENFVDTLNFILSLVKVIA